MRRQIYQCPRCESINLVARIDGRLHINDGGFFPVQQDTGYEPLTWQHVDCLDCGECFEGAEIHVVEGYRVGLADVADLLNKDPRILSAVPECNGAGNYSVNGSLKHNGKEFWYAAGFLNDPSPFATSDGVKDLVIVIDVFEPDGTMRHVAGHGAEFPLLDESPAAFVDGLMQEMKDAS